MSDQSKLDCFPIDVGQDAFKTASTMILLREGLCQTDIQIRMAKNNSQEVAHVHSRSQTHFTRIFHMKIIIQHVRLSVAHFHFMPSVHRSHTLHWIAPVAVMNLQPFPGTSPTPSL